MVATSTNCCVESLLGKRVDTRRVVSSRDRFSVFGRLSKNRRTEKGGHQESLLQTRQVLSFREALLF
jgi:hypothetical protein